MKVEKLQVQEVNLKTPAEKNFEVHKEHHDLFTCVEGKFYILIGVEGHEKPLSEYDKERDFLSCECSPTNSYLINQGESFLIKKGVPHKPGILADQKTPKATIILAKLVD